MDPVSEAFGYFGRSILEWTLLGAGAAGAAVLLRPRKEPTPRDRTQHHWIIGQTNTGKTTYGLNLALKDVKDGHAVVFIDTHGEAAMELAGAIPREHVHRTVYFAPYWTQRPLSINPLRIQNTAEEKARVANSLISVFQQLFGHGWGHSTEDLIRMAIWAVLEREREGTIFDIYRMLTDDAFRMDVVEEIAGKNPMVEQFWRTDFELVSRGNLNAPLNKLRKFLIDPIVLNTTCQTENVLDIDDLLDGKVLICDLNKDRLTEPVSHFLASLIMALIQTASFRRRGKRGYVFVYCDEFQGYVNATFQSMLSELRKFRVGVILMNQYAHQLPDGILSAIHGNVGTWTSFRIGEQDAAFVAKKFGLPPKRLENLPNHYAAFRRMVGGKPQPVIIEKTPPPPVTSRERALEIQSMTMERYGGKPYRPERESWDVMTL